MKIKVICYLVSVVAFGVFVFALTLAKDDPVRGQAIYWLGLAAVFAIFSEIKRFNIIDIEVKLKKDPERVEKPVEEPGDTLFMTEGRERQDGNDTLGFTNEEDRRPLEKFQKYLDSLHKGEELQA